MFGDAMFDEEDRLRRAEAGQDPEDSMTAEDGTEELLAAGGLDERLRRRQALTQLLREVGGV